MSALLDVALQCVARGWYVFPCWPKSKKPMLTNGWHGASNDPEQIRAWWSRNPNANVAIACNPSNLCVVDIDHGLDSVEALELWLNRSGISETRAVRTGRRPEWGVQLYYEGAMPDVGLWRLNGCEGQVKSLGGYVMAAGSVHPDSGETYEALWDEPFVGVNPTPETVRALKPERQASTEDDGQPITSNRNVRLTSIAGKLRSAGMSLDELEAALVSINERRCDPPMDEDEVKRIAANVSKYKPADEPVAVTIGGTQRTQEGGKEREGEPSDPIDWRTRYMTAEQAANVKEPEFLIDGFLVKESIAMLAGPVAQRKSIIALNVAHALCTGEPLFGFFEVLEKPERVVYLCPEMGAASFLKRIKQVGLGEYIGKTLFIQTMSETATTLDELDGELPGAVVLLDTITRFVQGDENSSADMRVFAQKVFRLRNCGASLVLLHHSKKGSAGTLDDGLRGSSELAAFVDSCWTTELEDPKKPYESLSKVRNVKQRDFECDPFKLTPSPGSYVLTMAGEPAPEAVLKSKADSAALDVLKGLLDADPTMGVRKLCSAMRKAGHGRGQPWVTTHRKELLGNTNGVRLTEA